MSARREARGRSGRGVSRKYDPQAAVRARKKTPQSVHEVPPALPTQKQKKTRAIVALSMAQKTQQTFLQGLAKDIAPRSTGPHTTAPTPTFDTRQTCGIQTTTKTYTQTTKKPSVQRVQLISRQPTFTKTPTLRAYNR
tara:strand:- start:244 stop:657 length:414 start_codon:yes stop_codon:yes gene_type:complete